MVKTTCVYPASVYRTLRKRGPVAWCEFGRGDRIIASLKQRSSDSRAEVEATLRASLSGQLRAPDIFSSNTREGRAPATLGRAPAVMGWLSYESGAWFERMSARAPELPRAWWGTVEECAVFDQHDHLVGMSAGLLDAHFEESYTPAVATGVCRSGTDRGAYEQGVRRILAHLHAGDCYQVNLARVLTVDSPGDPLDAWLRVRRDNPARRSMLIETPEVAVVSNSPELLLRARGRRLLSVPIKGTAPPGASPRVLLHSEKERAELTMIVDLVRSDLGRVAAPGSVVAGPRRVGRVGHVLHACQRIFATLDAGNDAVHALAAIFPPGSVTGAPKVRAMEIIADLEAHPRGVYCGAMGWAGLGAMDLNVAIRTMTFRDGVATVPVGAGIVIGSDPGREFAETELKAARMLAALC